MGSKHLCVGARWLFAVFWLVGNAIASTVTVDVGERLDIGFRLGSPFTGTPGVIRSGVFLTSGPGDYVSNVSLYDGATRLGGPAAWAAGFPFIGGAFFATDTDFTTIRDRSINGRFVLEPTSRSVSFDPTIPRSVLVDLTNSAGTAIVGNGTITSIAVNGAPVYEQPDPFDTRVNPESNLLCGRFGGAVGVCPGYRMRFDGSSVTITVDVGLRGAVPSDLRRRWEDGIERIWGSNRFSDSDPYLIQDGPNQYPVYFDVRFRDGSVRGHDAYVDVIAGSPAAGSGDCWNVATWYTNLECAIDPTLGVPDLFHEAAAAHEFGHMLGLYDEYYGPENTVGGPFGIRCFLDFDLSRPINSRCDGLMGSLSRSTVQRYYDEILANFNDETGAEAVWGALPRVAPSQPTIDYGQRFGSNHLLSAPGTLPLLLVAIVAVPLVARGRRYVLELESGRSRSL